MGSQRMRRWLASTVVLAPLALLGACLEMAPASSVPFQASAERQARYAAEITLAVKEDRRGETSEAAANGRMVLPQLPEVWVPPAAADPRFPQAPRALDPARLEPGAGSAPTGGGCVSRRAEIPGAPPSFDCRPSGRGRPLTLAPFDERSILSATAPPILDEASGPEPGPAS
jgi:hypothetical protein